ncbi:hypothetical protein A33M_2051 [Rhodovulum sp. PH10]|nr:hypothetical protein A33M_2051 [Rhodovulum sp. PH10]
MTILLLPALWNRFPLLQYDSGGYIARWYEDWLVPSRSTTFGLFLHLGEWPDFWPVIVVQSALTVWVVGLTLRVFGLGGKPWRSAALIGGLAVATALPWLTSAILTDVFVGLGVLALHLLVVRPAALRRGETIGLFLVVAFAAASHTGTLAVLLALVAAAFAATLVRRPVAPLAAIGRGAAALLVGAAMLLATNLALGHRLAWTPGGYAIPFGRMLQDGIVARYLDDTCGRKVFALCPYRHDLPATADLFFWGGSMFDRLGRFDGMAAEMRAIVRGSLAAYPGLQAEKAAEATAEQLAANGTGWGMGDDLWHTYGIIGHYLPGMVPAMRAARQQRGEIDFARLNRLHRPVAAISMILAVGLIGWSVVRRRPAPLAPLALLASSVMLAILANAVVCGAISGPHDRYGARVAWLATLVVAMAAMAMVQARRRDGTGRDGAGSGGEADPAD